MKKLIYSFATVLLGLTSCISFDDATRENYGAGPSVDVTVSAGIQTDSAFTVTITPAQGALYYAFVVGQSDAPEAVDSATLYKGGYGNTVLKVADYPSYTFNIDDADPNTTYWVYAVAGSDKGIIGNLVAKSITTTDKELPYPTTIAKDADNAAVQLGFSEAITRSEGAVTAKYYQEWDIMNPVDVAEENISVEVSGSNATFAAAGVPAGAYLCFSYSAGAFKDLKGNNCEALNSGLNMETGKFTGAWVHVTNKPFAIEDSYVTAPESGALIPSVDAFRGAISFPFDIFRNDEEVKASDVVVTFTNGARSTSYNLDPSLWSAAGKVLTFFLPATPEQGDQISVSIAEGAVYDVCGNPNLAYKSVADWKFFAPQKEMFLGNFGVYYISYFDDTQSVASMGAVSIEEDAEVENGLLINGLLIDDSQIEASYDLSTAQLIIPDFQFLGYYTAQSGDIYSLFFATADGTDAATFTLSADGTLTANGMWGIYALDETMENEVGWFDVAAVSELAPLDTAARKAFARGAKATKKAIKKINKKNISRKLNKRARK